MEMFNLQKIVTLIYSNSIPFIPSLGSYAQSSGTNPSARRATRHAFLTTSLAMFRNSARLSVIYTLKNIYI